MKQQRLFFKKKKGFTFIELVLVMALIGILVLIAAPRFLGYTKDAAVSNMVSDTKILTDATMIYRLKNNSVWPLGEAITPGDNLAALIGTATVRAIDETALSPYVKSLAGEYSDYGIVTSGPLARDVVHLSGVIDKDDVLWFAATLGANVVTGVPIVPEEPEEPVEPVTCATGIPLATDADFSGDADGDFRYIGTATEVRIPHVIKGVPVTSYYGMFSPTYGATGVVTKVVSNNPSITNMSYMFYNSASTSLTVIMDTANVTNMNSMFYASKATVLDLSSFDTSKVTDVSAMFRNALTTTGYAKTAAAASLFNSSKFKPSGLTFIVP